jgi:2,6-dihydroxypseudooxynicotine hydrolase
VADERLDYLWSAFGWRFAAHLPAWDLQQLREELESFDDWCRAWCRHGDRHAAIGDADSLIRAALFFHFASFLFPHDQEQFRDALARMEDAMTRAAPLVDPPMERVEIPFEGVPLPGYLRLPSDKLLQGRKPPLAVICPGGDSTKEEFYAFGEQIVRRGVAVFSFDGPGHGAISLRLKMRPDWEVVISHVLDHLFARDDWDHERLAVGGFSYGALFSLRAAARDDRIAAVFPCYSWYSPAGRYAKGHPVSQAGVRQYMGDDPPAVQDRITLDGVLDRVTVPVLQLYGADDTLSPPEAAYRIEQELAGPCTTIVQPDAVHVGNNVWYETRALLADWLQQTLH